MVSTQICQAFLLSSSITKLPTYCTNIDFYCKFSLSYAVIIFKIIQLSFKQNNFVISLINNHKTNSLYMKSYFNFQLTGKKFFPLWILQYLIVIIPYLYLVFKLKNFQNPPEAFKTMLIFWLVTFIIIIAAIIFTFYIVKIIVKNIGINDNLVQCNYKMSDYLEMVLLGVILTIITLGIYSPWFIRDLHRFFINNSNYKAVSPKFKGKGLDLFLIITLSLIIPIIWFIVLMVSFKGININAQSIGAKFLLQSAMYIMLIPYLYLSYKWIVNISYKDYIIKWNTKTFPSLGKIFVEMFFSIITIGIYLPMAMLNLYKYFADRTESNVVEGKMIKFGYDIEPMSDFIFIWGQILLSVITIGIYYPWAFCKITSRILKKTFYEV